MKRFFTYNLMGLAAAMACAAVNIPSGSEGMPARKVAGPDPFNVKSLTVAPKKAPALAAIDRAPKKMLKSLKAPEFQTVYTGAFQSYFEEYEFAWTGGEFLCYDVALDIEGTVATFTHLFNLEEGYPYDYSVEYELKGVYDAEAGTVTIPTPREFDQATIAGMIYNYYPAVVVSGTVDSAGKLESTPELVFTLSEDNTKLTTNQDFGVMMYMSDGTPQGFKCIYKGGVMLELGKASEIVCFTKNVDFGRCYAGESTTASIKVFNLSEESASVEVETDSEKFSCADSTVDMPALTTGEVNLNFSPSEVGVEKGIVTLRADGNVYEVALTGECIEAIDYSSLVKEGDMTFSTGAEYPFEFCEIEGHTAARSSCKGVDGCESYLTASFDVEEGYMGVFSWKGISNSEVAYAALPSIMTGDVVIGHYEGLLNADISGSYNFGPGHHEVTFLYSVGWASYFGDNDYMAVYDLALTSEKLEEHKAELKTQVLRMPNSLLTEEGASKNGGIELENLGSAPLEIVSVADADHFRAKLPSESAAFLDTVVVPVEFSSDTAGEFSETLVISTTAGEFEVKCEALVREMPDFSQIVKTGDFTFTTDEQNPFLVADGKAYNSTSKVPDTALTYCTLRANFEVPESKLGKLSWKGLLDAAEMVDGMWSDYMTIQISSSRGTTYTVVPGKYDLDTSLYPYIDSPDMSDLICAPGNCSLTFTYVQYGDGIYGGEDLVEIYDLGLELIDASENSAVIDSDEVVFPEIYAGKRTTARVTLLNTGTEPLEVFYIEGDGTFEGYEPTYTAPYNQTLDVTLTFEPQEAGEHNGLVYIDTSAGTFEVKCKGYAKSTEGFLLIEDFEGDVDGWTIYDRDGDGDAWNLAWNVYGGFPQGHVHSGEDCIVSFSWDYINGTFTPDNWTFSPAFNVPETGAWLTWWSAGDDNSRPGDVYSVYVGEGLPEIGQSFDLDLYECVYTETVVSDEWTYHEVDLSKFADCTVHVAFRHYDCSGCYMVKIDDVFVYEQRPTGIQQVVGEQNARIVSTKIYTVDGIELKSIPTDRVVLVTTTYSDGTTRTHKMIRGQVR